MNEGDGGAVPGTSGRGWAGAMDGRELFKGRGGREAAMDNGTRSPERGRGERIQAPYTFEQFNPKQAERMKAGLLVPFGAMAPGRAVEHADELLNREQPLLKNGEGVIEPVYAGSELARLIGQFPPEAVRDAQVAFIERALQMQARNWSLLELARAVFRLAEGPVVVREKRFNGGGR